MNMRHAAAAGVALVLCLIIEWLTGCTPRSRPAASTPSDVGTTRLTSAPTDEALPVPAPSEEHPVRNVAPPRSVAEDEADRIFHAMHPKLMTCYARRLASLPSARAYLVVDVRIDADGRPGEVSTTGGGALGREAVACIVGHVRNTTFRPPASGGASRVRVPLTFRPDASVDDG